MEKLLRILFVMCAIAFVTTATACADDNKTAKTGGNDKTAKTGGDDKTAKTGGDAKTANAGGNDKPAINPDFFLFTPEANGVTIDDSKDVYKITINPSLLAYEAPLDSAPIFTVTFTDDKKGFIIPTTVDKAEDLTTKHETNLTEAVRASFDQGNNNNVTYSFLTAVDDVTTVIVDESTLGFSTTETNAAWSTLTSAAVDIEPFTEVRVLCATTITGITAVSFAIKDPTAKDDLAIAKGTETVCKFSLVAKMGIDDAKRKTARKNWAKAAVELAKDDATKNIQKMGFVGIVTGDATASAITTAAGITEDADALGVKGFTADASAKLVKAYKISFQKVEIVIAPVK